METLQNIMGTNNEISLTEIAGGNVDILLISETNLKPIFETNLKLKDLMHRSDLIHHSSVMVL